MKKFIIISLFNFLSLISYSQVRTDISVDLVSSHIWRGVYSAGSSIQPSTTIGFNKFDLSIWGSSDFHSEIKKIEPTLFYSFDNIKLGVTDYWDVSNLLTKYNSSHLLETSIWWNIPKLKLTLNWNTLVYGDEGARSSYFSATYSSMINSMWFTELTLGLTPWENQTIGTRELSITNLSWKIGKVFEKSDYQLIPFTQLTYNPTFKLMHFVVGLSIPIL